MCLQNSSPPSTLPGLGLTVPGLPQMVRGHAGWYQVYSKARGTPQMGVAAHVAREPACLQELSLLIPRCLCIAFKMRFHEVGNPLVARASFNAGCQAAPAYLHFRKCSRIP